MIIQVKVLWLVNIPLPEVCHLMGEQSSPFGGWLINASKYLAAQDNIVLSIAFPRLKIKDVMEYNGEKINYFAFPHLASNDDRLMTDNSYLKSIVKQVQPDIVHIFGTEFAHSLAMVNVCNDLGVQSVISIQGLVSYIEKHYLANLPNNVQKGFTFRDFVKQNNILQQKKDFKKRGLLEMKAIQKAKHVIGRTTWDRACALQLNPTINYHFCNETLRETFYSNAWSIEKCEKYSIFLSHSSYPIKGLHYMLEALPTILRSYPKAKIYIAGPDITASNNLKDRLKQTSYAKYITRLIKELKIEEHVHFTGMLDEQQMCNRYLKSNVFVCPSSIENSPNSLGEAMILGVPCIASNVGGISDMLVHGQEGFLYPADAPYMLAHYVNEVFGSGNLANDISSKARIHALKTHDCFNNNIRLMNIYHTIFNENQLKLSTSKADVDSYFVY